jgi:hypothetical protein
MDESGIPLRARSAFSNQTRGTRLLDQRLASLASGQGSAKKKQWSFDSPVFFMARCAALTKRKTQVANYPTKSLSSAVKQHKNMSIILTFE